MANYNVSAFNNSAVNLTTYFVVANQLSNNWFGALMALAWFVIIFVSLKNFGNGPALAAASSTTVVFVIYGRAANLVSDNVLFIAIAITALVAVFVYLSKN